MARRIEVNKRSDYHNDYNDPTNEQNHSFILDQNRSLVKAGSSVFARIESPPKIASEK